MRVEDAVQFGDFDSFGCKYDTVGHQVGSGISQLSGFLDDVVEYVIFGCVRVVSDDLAICVGVKAFISEDGCEVIQSVFIFGGGCIQEVIPSSIDAFVCGMSFGLSADDVVGDVG